MQPSDTLIIIRRKVLPTQVVETPPLYNVGVSNMHVETLHNLPTPQGVDNLSVRYDAPIGVLFVRCLHKKKKIRPHCARGAPDHLCIYTLHVAVLKIASRVRMQRQETRHRRTINTDNLCHKYDKIDLDVQVHLSRFLLTHSSCDNANSLDTSTQQYGSILK